MFFFLLSNCCSDMIFLFFFSNFISINFVLELVLNELHDYLISGDVILVWKYIFNVILNMLPQSLHEMVQKLFL